MDIDELTTSTTFIERRKLTIPWQGGQSDWRWRDGMRAQLEAAGWQVVFDGARTSEVDGTFSHQVYAIERLASCGVARDEPVAPEVSDDA